MSERQPIDSEDWAEFTVQGNKYEQSNNGNGAFFSIPLISKVLIPLPEAPQ